MTTSAAAATATTADVDRHLELLEKAVDLDWEREKLAVWKRFLALESVPGGFRIGASPRGARPVPPWPKNGFCFNLQATSPSGSRPPIRTEQRI